MSRQMSVREQTARREELARIAARRPLTPTERIECGSLDHRFYMRAWRQQQRERWL